MFPKRGLAHAPSFGFGPCESVFGSARTKLTPRTAISLSQSRRRCGDGGATRAYYYQGTLSAKPGFIWPWQQGNGRTGRLTLLKEMENLPTGSRAQYTATTPL